VVVLWQLFEACIELETDCTLLSYSIRKKIVVKFIKYHILIMKSG